MKYEIPVTVTLKSKITIETNCDKEIDNIVNESNCAQGSAPCCKEPIYISHTNIDYNWIGLKIKDFCGFEWKIVGFNESNVILYDKDYCDKYLSQSLEDLYKNWTLNGAPFGEEVKF